MPIACNCYSHKEILGINNLLNKQKISWRIAKIGIKIILNKNIMKTKCYLLIKISFIIPLEIYWLNIMHTLHQEE